MGQALEEGILKGHVGLHLLQPRDQVLPGVSPQAAGMQILAKEHVGGGLVGLVTPGAMVMILVLASQEIEV